MRATGQRGLECVHVPRRGGSRRRDADPARAARLGLRAAELPLARRAGAHPPQLRRFVRRVDGECAGDRRRRLQPPLRARTFSGSAATRTRSSGSSSRAARRIRIVPISATVQRAVRDGHAYRVVFQRDAKRYDIWGGTSGYSPEFRADNGFVVQNDYRRTGLWSADCASIRSDSSRTCARTRAANYDSSFDGGREVAQWRLPRRGVSGEVGQQRMDGAGSGDGARRYDSAHAE